MIKSIINAAVGAFYQKAFRTPNFAVVPQIEFEEWMHGEDLIYPNFMTSDGYRLASSVGEVKLYFYGGDKILVGIE